MSIGNGHRHCWTLRCSSSQLLMWCRWPFTPPEMYRWSRMDRNKDKAQPLEFDVVKVLDCVKLCETTVPFWRENYGSVARIARSPWWSRPWCPKRSVLVSFYDATLPGCPGCRGCPVEVAWDTWDLREAFCGAVREALVQTFTECLQFGARARISSASRGRLLCRNASSMSIRTTPRLPIRQDRICGWLPGPSLSWNCSRAVAATGRLENISRWHHFLRRFHSGYDLCSWTAGWWWRSCACAIPRISINIPSKRKCGEATNPLFPGRKHCPGMSH